jgi:hypothetical protein
MMRPSTLAVPGAIVALMLSGCGDVIHRGGNDVLDLEDSWVNPAEPDPWADVAATDEPSSGRDPSGCRMASGIAHGDRTRLSYAAIAALANSAGIKCGYDLVTAVAVASAESGRYQYAYLQNKNCTYDRGLWQINGYYWKKYSSYDIDTNAEGMVEISQGGTDFTPWAVYNNDKFGAYWDSACVAVGEHCGQVYCE